MVSERHTQGRDKQEVGAPPRGEPQRLRHVQLAGKHPAGQLPVEVVQEGGERELHVGQPERHPGAHTPPGAERYVLEVRPLEVGGADALEPLRRELLRRVPVRRVPADRPRVDEHHHTLRHVEAHHPARLPALPRQQHRHRRVQPERLLDDEVQVGEIAQALLGDAVLPGNGEGSSDLVLRLAHHPRVPHQLRHGPLQRRRRRLAARHEHVLHKKKRKLNFLSGEVADRAELGLR
ncbi:Os01g0377250 [Oryza sativa Japonica Group]|uniref:Os01g0377250 protein n=1 Tax=Oryza sativa subsp. japonica TaxID=39947 RepID=A0A0P0V393_ORYSJ|nr:hypothetical protein EE612_002730 [Oryza sativa]BAS72211.1 Os01g0377250 [Oryza sativa Japonica Group]